MNYLDNNTKDLIYSNNIFVEDEKTRKMYNLTHGLTEPGEQKDRNYKWNFDKNTHVFGKPETMEKDGTKKSLQTDLLFSEYPQTKIGNKRLEDFRQATSSLVGTGKFKGTLNDNIPHNHAFGTRTMKDGNWNVGKCLSGNMDTNNRSMLTHDVDLGKSFNYTNKNKKLHPTDLINGHRLFGVPSVRTDLQQKGFRSVSDYTVSKSIYII
jgi:hypothetical protein